MLKHLFILVVLFGSLTTYGNDKSLNQMREEVKSIQTWHYPYPEIMADLEQKQQSSILIFTYGSLMDVNSASRTLSPESLATRRPAMAFDVRRVFDRDVAIKPDLAVIPLDPNARGMLNVWPSNIPGDLVNGVLIDITLEDIPKVLFRETGYDLIPIVVQEWDASLLTDSPSYKFAYTFHAPIDSEYTSHEINPRPVYYELTRDAAATFGPLFGAMWLNTTFMSDGVTPISDWEIRVQNGDPLTTTIPRE